MRVPAEWRGVRLDAAGASSLRVHATTAAAGELALVAVDHDGSPVLSVDAVRPRALDARAVGAARAGHDSLFRVEWTPVEAASNGGMRNPAVIGDLDIEGDRVDRLADLDGAAPDVVFATAPPSASAPH